MDSQAALSLGCLGLRWLFYAVFVGARIKGGRNVDADASESKSKLNKDLVMRWKILIGLTVAVLVSTLLWMLLVPTVTIGPLEIR